MNETVTDSLARRGKTAFRLGALVLLGSSALFYLLGCLCGMNAGYGKDWKNLEDDRWELTECIYFSAITLTTIGYTDLLGTEQCSIFKDAEGRFRWESNTDAHQDFGYDRSTEGKKAYRNFTPWTRLLTSVVSILGMAFFLYVIAQVTSFFVEGGYEELAATNRARKKISRLSGHVVICGFGDTGRTVLKQTEKEGIKCAVIEHSEDAVKTLRREYPQTPCLRGDAGEDVLLEAAGVERAQGVVAVLPEDRTNLAATVIIRQLSPEVRIVSRAIADHAARRLCLAGASAVVNTPRLTGLRIASELIRPVVVDFLGIILGHNDEQDLIIDGIALTEKHAGLTMDRMPLEQFAGVEIVALRRGDGSFAFNPHGDETITAGDELAVVGNRNTVRQLARVIAESAPPHSPDQPESSKPKLDTNDNGMKVASAADKIGSAGHYIICGASSIGRQVAMELHTTHRSCACVDTDLMSLKELQAELPGIRIVEGEGFHPTALTKADIKHACGLATLLDSHRDNLVVVVTALQANPSLRILSVANDKRSRMRLERAGANTIRPGEIGGRRVVAELLRPAAATLLDRMLAAGGAVRFEAVVVKEGAEVAGLPLGEAKLFKRTGLRVLAMRQPGEQEFLVRPEDDVSLETDTILVVAGPALSVESLAALVGGWA